MNIPPEAIQFIVASLFMVATIPREHLRRIFPASLVYGLLAPLLGAVILRYVFGVRLSHTLYTIVSLDLWLLLTGIPKFAIFFHFLPPRDTWQFWVYVTTFAVLSTVVWRAFAHAGRLAGPSALLILAGTFAGYAIAPYFQQLFSDHRPEAPPDPWSRGQ